MDFYIAMRKYNTIQTAYGTEIAVNTVTFYGFLGCYAVAGAYCVYTYYCVYFVVA